MVPFVHSLCISGNFPFIYNIYFCRSKKKKDDLMILKETRDGCFSVKLLFKALVRSDDIVFPHTFIWNSWVSTKVSFFCMESLLG